MSDTPVGPPADIDVEEDPDFRPGEPPIPEEEVDLSDLGDGDE